LLVDMFAFVVLGLVNKDVQVGNVVFDTDTIDKGRVQSQFISFCLRPLVVPVCAIATCE
jgi:hypothetical protein